MDIKTILDTNEEIVLRAKPKLIPFLFNNSMSCVFFGVFLVLFMGIFANMVLGIFSFGGFAQSNNINMYANPVSTSPQFIAATVSSFALTITLLYCSLILIIYVVFLIGYKNYEYLITTKRVIFSSGVFGRNIKMLDFDKIQNIEVSGGLLNRIFGAGTISFFTGESQSGYSNKDSFYSVDNPYAILKTAKEIIFDVKSDLEYPNDLRPATNSGYKTEYKK